MNDQDSQKDKGFDEEDFVFEEEEEVIGEETSKDKIKNLKQELKAISADKQRLMEDLQRAKADFINMRKRDEADLERALKLANEAIFLEIIPVLDSFELAFNDKSFAEAPPNFREGMNQVYSQLQKVLSGNGVEILDPVGEIFDPQIHTAVQILPTENESDDHRINRVMQKGYRLNNKIIRSPKVIINEFQK